MLQDLVASGRIVDVIVGIMAIEATVLYLYHRRTFLGVAPFDLAAMLMAGLFLLLALRAALTGSDWIWVAAFLAASFVAHLADLRRRWRA